MDLATDRSSSNFPELTDYDTIDSDDFAPLDSLINTTDYDDLVDEFSLTEEKFL